MRSSRGLLGYFNNAFTTTDGSSQVIVLVNGDVTTLSPHQQNDIVNALLIGLCGRA